MTRAEDHRRTLTISERSYVSRSVSGCRMSADEPVRIPGVKAFRNHGGDIDLSMIPGRKPRTGRTAALPAPPVHMTRAEARKAKKARKRAALAAL